MAEWTPRMRANGSKSLGASSSQPTGGQPSPSDRRQKQSQGTGRIPEAYQVNSGARTRAHWCYRPKCALSQPCIIKIGGVIVTMALLHQCAASILDKASVVPCPDIIEPRAAESLSVGGLMSTVS